MTFANLDHLPFNKGWRWKISERDEQFILGPGETKELQSLNLEDEDVLAGWIVYANVSATSDQIVADAVTEPPGPEGERRAGEYKAADLLSTGATEARAGLPWAEHTTVNGQDIYTIWINAFGGFAIPVRFPEYSRVEIKNPSDSEMTVTGYRVGSLLIHKPELFFKQVAAFNALSGNVETEVVREMDDEAVGDLLEMLSESPD